MNDNTQTEGQVFFGQWTRFKRLSWALVFHKPTCTVPDQSMTIQEIIAKYTRTGLVPSTVLRKDEGGQAAFDPDFDPLDNGQDFMDSQRVEGPAESDKGGEAAPISGAGETGGASAPANAGKEGVSEL